MKYCECTLTNKNETICMDCLNNSNPLDLFYKNDKRYKSYYKEPMKIKIANINTYFNKIKKKTY